MIVRVHFGNQHYDVTLQWERVAIPPFGCAWRMLHIEGERLAGGDEREVCRRAVVLAEQAMRDVERSGR